MLVVIILREGYLYDEDDARGDFIRAASDR